MLDRTITLRVDDLEIEFSVHKCLDCSRYLLDSKQIRCQQHQQQQEKLDFMSRLR